MEFEWTAVTGRSSLILQGLQATLLITATALVIGAALGLFLCILRLAEIRYVSKAARMYVTFFRITPELVLIFWVYYCFPALFELRLSAWLSGTLALALVSAAYLAEIYRAGIEAVPRGQIEAARAIALGNIPLWYKILLPQAVRIMTPPFLNYLTELLKNSTLLAGIGVAELAYQAYTAGAQSYRYMELFTAVAVLFFAIIFPISVLTRAREARLARVR